MRPVLFSRWRLNLIGCDRNPERLEGNIADSEHWLSVGGSQPATPHGLLQKTIQQPWISVTPILPSYLLYPHGTALSLAFIPFPWWPSAHGISSAVGSCLFFVGGLPAERRTGSFSSVPRWLVASAHRQPGDDANPDHRLSVRILTSAPGGTLTEIYIYMCILVFHCPTIDPRSPWLRMGLGYRMITCLFPDIPTVTFLEEHNILSSHDHSPFLDISLSLSRKEPDEPRIKRPGEQSAKNRRGRIGIDRLA